MEHFRPGVLVTVLIHDSSLVFIKNIITVLFSPPFSAPLTNTFESSEKGKYRDGFVFVEERDLREQHGFALMQPIVSPEWESSSLEGLNSGKSLFKFSAHEAEKEVCARQGFLLTLQVPQYWNEMEGYLGRHCTCRDTGGKQENTGEKLHRGEGADGETSNRKS